MAVIKRWLLYTVTTIHRFDCTSTISTGSALSLISMASVVTWGGLLIEYHTAQVMVVLGLALAIVRQVGSWLRELKRHS